MNMRERFLREVAAAGLPAGPDRVDVIGEEEIASLPQPARRFLRFMGVVGRARDWSFRLGFRGRFRIKPQDPWMRCEAWQYNSRLALARIFHIRIRMLGLVPIVARDTYIDGHGRMLVEALDLFPIADGTGEQFDIGELVTYLGDAVLVAPSMLLVPEVSWTPCDSNSFDVMLKDHDRTVTARVFVDEKGAPLDFNTTDRFYYDPDRPQELVRARWSTPVSGWNDLDGVPRPMGAQAVWHLPQGPFTYADFRLIPGTAAFNLHPGI
jgi:hypothetical protein